MVARATVMVVVASAMAMAAAVGVAVTGNLRRTLPCNFAASIGRCPRVCTARDM